MPIEDFMPGEANAEGVDTSRTYLIKGDTLKRLLARLTFADDDFRIEKQGENRTVHLKKGGGTAAGGDFDIGFYTCVDAVTEPTFDFTLSVRGGAASISTSAPDSSVTTFIRTQQISCFDAEGP